MLTKFLESSSLQKIASYLTTRSLDDPALFIIEVMLYTGCRCDEAITLRPIDFDVSRRCVLIRRPVKGSRPRAAPLPDLFMAKALSVFEAKGLGPESELGLMLGEMKTCKDNKKRLLRARFSVVKIKALGVGEGKGISLHSFRHTFAKNVYEATGRDIMAVQLGLGHKSISSTMYYLKHISYDLFSEVFRKASEQ